MFQNENGTTQYLYGNPNHPFQLTAVRSPSGSLSRYHYDDFGLLFALERDNNWYYITTDQLGTPRVVCDANGTLVKVLEYDSFGQIIADSNREFELHISFAGGLIDVDTELVRFGFRDYDAVAGKWTAKDPIGFAGGDGNQFAYVVNSPINFVDSFGLNKRPCPLHPNEQLQTINGHLIPFGVSLDQNIREAEQHYWLSIEDARWFYDRVKNKSYWDYKQGGKQYEYFGNFNFGATGAAAGFPLDILLRGAGWAQTKARTSTPEWGSPYFLPPYGDSPHDQKAITDGYTYYIKNYYLPTMNKIR